MPEIQTNTQQTPGKSGMAIAGLVLGIIALASSWMPIINNLSAILGVLGVIFAAVGFMGIKKGKKTGKGLAVAALIISIVSIVVVLGTQSLYSAALDEAVEGPKAVSSSSSTTNTAKKEVDLTQLAVGETATLSDGSKITVNSVKAGLKNYDGSAVTCVNVTYDNGSKSELSFNSYDWKAEDNQGAQRSVTYYSKQSEELSYGSLAVGGTVTGNIYFEGEPAKILYFAKITSSSATAGWIVS